MPETTPVELRHAKTVPASDPTRADNDITHPIDSPLHPLAALWRALWEAEGSGQARGH